MVDINLGLSVLIIFLSAFIPGVLIALPLLKRTKTSLVEIALFGMILGIVLPPLVVFLLSFIGVKFSVELALGSIVLVTLIGLVWNMKERSFPTSITFDYKNLSWIFLLIIVLVSFYARLQSFGPTFFEFDPYFYQYTTKFILTEGYVPVVDTTAWYPNLYTHRGALPLMNYLVAEWYGLITGSLAYDNYALASLSGVYPALVGALLSFTLYVLLKEEYGKWFGVIGAAFGAFLPLVVQKLAAGVMEIQPWGIFSSFFFFAALALAVNRGSRRYAVLAGLAYWTTNFGSAYTLVITVVYAVYMGLITTIAFLRRNKYETEKLFNFEFLQVNEIRRLVEISGIILVFAASAYLVETAYRSPAYNTLYGYYDIVNPNLMASVMVFVYTLVLYFASPITEFVSGLVGTARKYSNLNDIETRGIYLGTVALIGILVIVLTPIDDKILGFIGGATAFAGIQSTVGATVAEENLLNLNQLSFQFEGSLGAIGSLVKIMILMISGIVSGLPVKAQLLVVYLFIFGPFIISILYSAYRGSKVSPLIGIIVLPLAYVGINKVKYVLHLTLVTGVAFVSTFGTIDRVLHEISKKIAFKQLGYSALILCAIITLFQFYPLQTFVGFNGYGNVGDVLITSISPSVRTEGVVDCNKLYAEHVSNHYAKSLSLSLYCSKIPQIWLDVMSWISKKTEPGSRIMSWWDYGHWTNFFGDRYTVTRGEHPYEIMDQEVANAFTNSPPEKLAKYMRTRDSRYVLFDWELVMGGGGDGKWGALNFLSCSYNNETSVAQGVGGSKCEFEHRYEYVYIPTKPDLNDVCNIGNEVFVKAYSTYGYVYCVRQISGAYEIYYENNFTQNRALLSYVSNALGPGNKELAMFMVIYHPDLGFEDKKGKAYDSSFYHGFFLGKMPGFVQVYPEDAKGFRVDIPIRVYKLLPLLELSNNKDMQTSDKEYLVIGRTEKWMKVAVNSEEVSLDSSYGFRKSIPLSKGQNIVTVEAVDGQGYKSVESFKVTYGIASARNSTSVMNSTVS